MIMMRLVYHDYDYHDHYLADYNAADNYDYDAADNHDFDAADNKIFSFIIIIMITADYDAADNHVFGCTGKYWVVLVSTWWYWVNIGWCWSVLGGTG